MLREVEPGTLTSVMASSLALALACAPANGPGPIPTAVWRDRALPDTVLSRAFDLAGGRSGTVTCRSADDPLEVHTAATDAHGTATIHGLLAETVFDCALASGRALEERSFETESLPDWLPRWTMAVEGDAGRAYTLFNHGTDRKEDRQPKLLIVDPEGRLRWYHPVSWNASDLDASYLGDGRILYGGGNEAPPTVVDLEGRVLMEAPALPDERWYHHDTERLASGEHLALTSVDNTDGTSTWRGAELQILDPALEGPVWTWSTQRGVDEGWLPGRERDGGDPYHANSAQGIGDQLYVNLRPLSLLVRLDRATGDLVWRMGQGGDFLLLDAAGAPAEPTAWWYGPHAPVVDGDRVLAYDNGATRPVSPRTSRAVEFTFDEATMTARTSWEFTEEGWFEGIWGDVDRLPSGHVLITRASCGRCLPDPATTQLVEVDPATNEVVWRLVMDLPEDAGYRAERVDGCALFANARYCP